MYYVYLLQSLAYNQTYTGFTKNLQQGLKDHNAGKSPHTKKFKPWQLVCYVSFDSEATAREFEAYLKTGSGIAFARKHFLK